ncbi:MAG: serine hydrolase [Moraxellaceae bacterium]|nr:serine hydrolase [Moraxellaceae bacterium]
MRTRLTLLITLTLVVTALVLFLFRPWSPWSPWRMNQMFWAGKRIDNFRHMEQMFPTVPMKPSDTPQAWPQAAAPLALPTTYVFNGEVRLTEAFLERSITTGLLVLRNGEVLHEEYRRGADAGTRFTSWSVAKSFVATLVGIALKEGKIASLDDKAEVYVPELRGKAYGQASLHDLLRMSSGVKFSEIYADRTADIHRVFYKTFIFGQSIDDAASDYPAEFPPGTRFHYNSMDTQMLSWVLREATGQPLAEYAQEKLWEPLGMQDDGLWNTDFKGNELGYCCLNITLRDYAKLGQLYLQHGQWNGVQLLPADWVTQSTQRPEPWLAAGNGFPERGYGHKWWVPKNPDREYFANGVWGQSIWVDEKTGTIIVKTSVDPDFQAHTAEMIEVMRAIAAHTDATPSAIAAAE